MYVVSRWDDLCDDSAWIACLLSWFEDLPASFLKGSHKVQIQINGKGKIGEVFKLSASEISSLLTSKLVANISDKITDWTTISRNNFKVISNKSPFYVRESDSADISSRSFSFYFRLMEGFYPQARRAAQLVEMQIYSGIAFSNKMFVTVSEDVSSSEIIFQMENEENQVFADSRIVLDPLSTVEQRYDYTRLVLTSPLLIDFGRKTRFTNDLLVVSLPCHTYECSSASQLLVSLVHWADVGISLPWEHVFPPECEFYTAKDDQNRRKFSVMWRGAICHVVSWPRPGSTLFCHSWVARTGNSTFDLQVDLVDNFKTPIASIQLSLTVVNRTTMKSSPVFHDKQEVDRRFAFAKSQNLQNISFIIPKPVTINDNKWSFEYKLNIRPSDQDLNGHVNSGLYFRLVDEARIQSLHHLPTDILKFADRFAWFSRFGIDYQGELKIDDSNQRVIVRYHQQSPSIVIFYFDFWNHERLCTKVWVESNLDVDIGRYHFQEKGDFSGCNPVDWGFPPNDGSIKSKI